MKNLMTFGILILMVLFTSCEKEAVDDQLLTADLNAKASVAAQKSNETIAEIVVSFASDDENPQFTLLLAALNYAGITSMFTESKKYTVFAPTDAAFENFLGNNSLTDFTPEQVASILSYHVTNGKRFSNSVVPKKKPRKIKTLLGPSIFVDSSAMIDTNDDDTNANAAILVGAGLFDIPASNGVIHVIDEVLVPEM